MYVFIGSKIMPCILRLKTRVSSKVSSKCEEREEEDSPAGCRGASLSFLGIGVVFGVRKVARFSMFEHGWWRDGEVEHRTGRGD